MRGRLKVAPLVRAWNSEDSPLRRKGKGISKAG